MRGILIGFVLLLVLLLPSVNAQEGIVSYWSFDNSSNPGKDYVGGNDGTVYGATWTAEGFKNDALSFDGADDYIEVPHDDSMSVDDELTVSAWINVQNDGMHHPIVVKANELVSGYHFVLGSEARLYLRTANNGNYSDVWVYFTDYYGDWHHVVGVFNGTNEILYIDGEKRGDETPVINQINPSTNVLRMGRSTTGYWGAPSRLNGTIDEVRIYNRTLTAEEILENYNEEKEGGKKADLNNDRIVDVLDMAVIAIHFGQTKFHLEWNETVDVVDNDEIDVFDLVYVVRRFSIPDTTPPEITSFDVQPRNTTYSITASWTVTDNQALKQAELWRTNDDNGQPYEGNWMLVPDKTQSISGTEASGSFTDTPPNGTFWYNLHVIDNDDNMGYSQPINVTKSAPPPCTGDCMTNPCESYDDCTNGSGMCLPGKYCCSGVCTPSGNVIYAASGSRDDIQAAIDSASDGDTVIIPAGTYDFGDGYVTFTDKLIHIRGVGIDSTIIQKTGTETTDKVMFKVSMPYKKGGPIFSDMKLIDTNGPYAEYDAANRTKGIVLGTGCWDFRVYNMEFEGFGESGLEANEYSGAEPYEWKQRGVIHNCNFIDNYMPGLGYGVVVYGANDKSWAEPAELGSAWAVFVEDCYFEGHRHHIASGLGSRYVFRYNTGIQNKAPAIDAHGCDPPCATYRGSLSVEVYGNNVYDPSAGTQTGFGPTGGDTGVVYNNTFTDMYYGCYLMAAGCYQAEPPCEYPETDQIRHLYIWGNTYNNCNYEVFVNAEYAHLIQENRDYFLYAKSGYTAYTYPHPLRG